MSVTTTPTKNNIGLAQIKLHIGTDVAGAPSFNFSGTVFDRYLIAGDVTITQALAEPLEKTVRVHGRRTKLVFGPATDYMAALHGQYVATATPPLKGAYLATLEILMKLDGPDSWNGVAQINYGHEHLENVPVKLITTPIPTN
ncbi:MAG TPA: DUF1842 domain-containing protein [Candidatus Elarobacter sp.]|jgi:hypothetical protein|nr:DUF1842 domain-containing protein [Candidatus Elarobacter sp.]